MFLTEGKVEVLEEKDVRCHFFHLHMDRPGIKPGLLQ
jgi:hypothetical protein